MTGRILCDVRDHAAQRFYAEPEPPTDADLAQKAADDVITLGIRATMRMTVVANLQGFNDKRSTDRKALEGAVVSRSIAKPKLHTKPKMLPERHSARRVSRLYVYENRRSYADANH